MKEQNKKPEEKKVCPSIDIDRKIKMAKMGIEWIDRDHLADWYSEKCNYIRQENERRENER